jgi:hypothetical protein
MLGAFSEGRIQMTVNFMNTMCRRASGFPPSHVFLIS